ncbi:P-loop containing nucleoside triphosphate hydrolase protein [Mycena rebaudengoi]|nr:P-loop containing nucleoside triphosphate hydrolase protein [Mycena rebaudengoi]
MYSGSDTSSICASAGSPPGSNLAVDDIQDWAQDTADAEASASGILISDGKARDIKIVSYTLSSHGRLLIEGAEIALNYGQRYGLLGENGSGKSTFLSSIAARDVEIPPHIDICLVAAEAEPSDVDAVDFLVASAQIKVAKLETYIEQLPISDYGDSLAREAAYEELAKMDPSTFEAKAGSILRGLGFSPTMMKKPTKDMNGGWRRRVALARALFIKPHLLLLDEPTSHLDLGAVVWLEAYLSAYNHTVVLTSHSQDFMDNVCTDIIDLTPKKKMVYYTGNYSTYVRTKQENEVNQMKAYQKQQEEIQGLKKYIAAASTYTNLVRQAKSKQRIIDKMEAAGLIEKIEVGRALRFNFEDVSKLPPPIIAFDSVAFAYSGKKEDYLYKNLSFGIDMDARIAILGANGTGKSTLLQLITGALQPSAGTISKHSALKLAKYSQHSADQLPYDTSPMEYFQQLFSLPFPEIDTQEWRSQLGRFGLSDAHQTAPIKQLSDGLRNRVVLAQLTMEHAHILLLDEPTNHLDMASVDALARAIKEFKGGVVIVSHDLRFISQVAGELWEVADGTIRNLTKADISIVDYKENLVKQNMAAIKKAALCETSDRGDSEEPASSTSLPPIPEPDLVHGPVRRLRKGMWNRRGDHLTLDGFIVYALADRAYPAELSDYPPETVGYRDHTGATMGYIESRPELPDSLPRFGQPPRRPYETFLVYPDEDIFSI